MEPVLNEQQSLFRDSAVRLCRDIGGPKRARQLRDGGSELDRDAWKQIGQAGWLGAAAPEAAGGLGAGMFELSLAMEEAGRQLLALPLVEACAAAWAIARAEDHGHFLQAVLDGSTLLVPALPQTGWGEDPGLPVAKADRRGVRLDGKVSFVPYAPSAQAFLMQAAGAGGEPVLCVVAADAAGLSHTTASNVDGSTSSELVLRDVPVDESRLVARANRARELAERVQEALLLGTSALLVGVASAALDMTVEYIKLRQQFGKPLGSFQALQHRVADRFVDIELNRSLVYRVSSAWDSGQAHPAMMSAAKARSSRCALDTTRTALQFHGAIGYTDEHDIGLYYKRAIVLAALYGNESNHTTRFSRLTLPAA
jgi:alkylation response protein AidB-like acyl-CoA dehydrogenase